MNSAARKSNANNSDSGKQRPTRPTADKSNVDDSERISGKQRQTRPTETGYRSVTETDRQNATGTQRGNETCRSKSSGRRLSA